MSTPPASNRGWREVTKSSPCSCCLNVRWCAWAPDGVTLKCERSTSAPESSGLRLLRLKDGGAFFRRTDAEPTTFHPPARRGAREKKPERDWSAIAAKLEGTLSESKRIRLADELGVRWQVLVELSLGWAEGSTLHKLRAGWSGTHPQDAYAFPERDGSGAVVGLSLRAPDGSKGAPKGSHRGLVIPSTLKQSTGTVLIVEGASDVAAARTLNLMAVGRPSNASGAAALAALLETRSVLVVGENDSKPNGTWPGHAGALRIAEELTEKWKRPTAFALPPAESKDVRAWLTAQVANGLDLEDEAGCNAAGRELLAALEREATTVPYRAEDALKTVSKPVLRAFDQIPRREMEWLWPGRFPLGKLVMIAGEPGTGKSTMTLDLAARVSRGEPWPDGAPCERGAVLLLSAEDDPEDTTGPRLDAADADGSLVLDFTGVAMASGVDGDATDRAVEIADLAELEETLTKGVLASDGTTVPFRLVVIDPLMAFMAGTDTNRSSDVRGALRPLKLLAERARVTVLLVQHPRKDESHNALNTVSGSKAFVEAVRAAWFVSKDPNDKRGPDRLFLVLKANVLPPGTTGLRFRLEELPDRGPNAVRVKWSPLAVDGQIDEVLADLADRERAPKPRDEAKAFLLEELADGPVPSKELIKQAQAVGIAERTLRRAFHDIGGRPAKRGLTHWDWSLPSTPPSAAMFEPGGQVQSSGLESAAPASGLSSEDGQHPEDGHAGGNGSSLEADESEEQSDD